MFSTFLGYAVAGVVIITASRIILQCGYGYYQVEIDFYRFPCRIIGWGFFLIGMGAVIKSFDVIMQAVLK